MTDQSRPDFDTAAFAGRSPAGWQLTVVAETGSTNADLLAAADQAPDGSVLLAEFQTGGRGRLERSWVSPARAGLTFSMLLRPSAPPVTFGWLPLLTGVALADTIGVGASLKWPNDVLLGPDEGKVAGILVQASGGAVVVGVGVNVSTTAQELPVPTSTSLALQGYSTSREELLAGFLAAFAPRYAAWAAHDGDAEASGLAAEYRARCATTGRRVSVQLADHLLEGIATGIDASGRLEVLPEGATHARALAAGDVTHLRGISR